MIPTFPFPHTSPHPKTIELLPQSPQPLPLFPLSLTLSLSLSSFSFSLSHSLSADPKISPNFLQLIMGSWGRWRPRVMLSVNMFFIGFGFGVGFG